jgi:hypothetical protein
MAFAIHPSPVGSHTTGRESLWSGLPTAKCCGQPYYWAGNPCGWPANGLSASSYHTTGRATSEGVLIALSALANHTTGLGGLGAWLSAHAAGCAYYWAGNLKGA